MNNTLRTLLLSVAVVCVVLPVLAQNAPAMPFVTFDRDSNGIVTEQEFNAIHAEKMALRDSDGVPMREPRTAPNFTDFDLNRDGRLLPDEFAAAHRSLMQNRPDMGMGRGMGMGRDLPTFAEFDLNQDGSLVEKEFYEARANRIRERSQQGYPMRNLKNAPDFKTIDLNGNGLIDPQEFDLAQARHRQQTTMPPSP